jgi:hypothetical protein
VVNDRNVDNTVVMKKVTWIYQIFLAAIILFLAAGCKKEEITSGKEWLPTHWPIVKALEATSITDSTATLNGTVITYGLATTVTFEFGTTANYGSIATAYQAQATEDSITYVSVNISGLTPCMPYHFRVRAENSLWTNFLSSDLTFIAGHMPTLTTSLSGKTATAITVEGNITYNGCTDIIDRGFILALIVRGGGQIITHNGTGTGSYVQTFNGLVPGQHYGVHPYAKTSAGMVYSNEFIFFTLQ